MQLPAVAVGLALLAAPAAAQSVVRLDFTEPQVVLSSGGRMGACDDLRFTRDGRQLLAVGDDMVVHTWGVAAGGLDARDPLRWNVFRERRGGIYALALSPDETHVAVGGYGRLDADVALIDRTSGKIAAALSAGNHPDYQVAATVWSLAYHPDADRVAVGLEDGSVFVWRPGETLPGRVTRLAGPVTGSPDEVQAMIGGRLAKVVWVGFHGDAVRYARGDGRVFEATPGEGPRELFRFAEPVIQVVAPRDGRWVAGRPMRQSPDGARIEARAFPGGEVVHAVRFRKNEKNEHKLFPLALATDADGHRLAVGSSRPAGQGQFFTVPPGEVAVYDLRTDPPTLAAVEAFDGTGGKPATAPETIAYHPDGRRLAIAGGHDHETGLWEIAGTALRRVGDPAVGVGRGVWQVGTANDGTVLCFRNEAEPAPAGANARGRGPWRRFDLTCLGWEASADGPADAAVNTLNGWAVEHSRSEFEWAVVHEDGFRYPLPFEKNTDDRPMCYTFLPGPKPRLVRLAVGTVWGVAVFEFGKGQAPKRVMKGVGHRGYVMSVAPARGGKMLVTGSTDQTACVWALQPWDHHPALGAAFDWKFDPKSQRQWFTATAVQDGSPAWEAGLLAGDRVARLGYNGAWLDDPAAWAARLEEVEPDRELVFIVQRSAGEKVIDTAGKTRLLTRPQARLFPTAGADWVLYKYLDYYYASSTNGDSYLGWQLNGKTAADTPELHPAARFRDVFFRPDHVRESVAGLIREPNRPLTREFVPPAVAVTAAARATADDPVRLDVTVTPRADVRGEPIPLETVELWLDDEVLLRSWAGGAEKFTTTVEVRPHELRVGKNRLTVVGYAKTRGEAAVVVEHAPGEVRKPTVRGVAVGVDRYPYLSPAEQLTASVNDAKLVKEAFEGLAKAGVVKAAAVEVLPDDAVTPAKVFERIEAAAKPLGPDDWLVLFFAGHGFADLEATEGGGRRVRPGSWFFCGYAARPADGLPAAPAGADDVHRVRSLIGGLKKLNVALDGKDLLARLARLNCRKLVLLDSCHSGAVAVDPGRDLRPGGRGAVVLTAAAPDEAASEFDIELDRGGETVTERHGFFSVAVYHALGRDRAATDRNKDGVITLEELHRAVAAAVRDGRREAGLDKPGVRAQTVLACPPDLRNVVFVPAK